MSESPAPSPPGRVRLGTQGWNYADWVGGFYPEGTKPAEFLGTYARAFDAVEVDSTFYAVPPVNTVRGWAARTPEGFCLALKMPREVTHERRLVDAEGVVEEFLERARLLGPKLGPVLVQMGPDFVPSEWDALERFLPRLPGDLRFAVELRHAGWMRPATLPDVLSLLAGHGVALALSDGRWIARETVVALAARPTADFHYVRWMGPNRDITRFSEVLVDRTGELETWAEALRPLPARGTDVYGFFNNHFAGHSPDSARRMQRLLGQRSVDPGTLGEQISLF